MWKTLFVLSASLICIMVLGADLASAQTTSTSSGQAYPSKPVRIVDGSVGGAGDLLARLIAEQISGPLGQPVIVENRPSSIGPDVVFRAPPDGYTLFVGGATFMFGPLLTKTAYDPVRDFSSIASLARQPNLLVVHPSLPVKSVKELIALAKARPGELNFAAGAPGGANQLAAALFAHMAGIKLVLIPYKDSAQSLTDLFTGVVHLTFESGAFVMPHVKSGKLRALAVTTAEPSALFPGLPTVAASLPGFDAAGRLGIWAPAKTPDSVIARLNQEIVRALNKADVKERLLGIGLEVAPSSPEQLAVTMKSEIAQMAKVIKDAGIHAD